MGETDRLFYHAVTGFSNTLMLVSPITFIALLYALYKRRRLSVPPGPTPFPLVGNIPQLIGQDMKNVLERYREKYGPVFTIHLFSKPIIICNGYEVLSKMLVDNSNIFSKRPQMEIPSMILPGKGIATASGEIWKKNRALLVHSVQKFGTTSRDGVVYNETKKILEAVERQNGEPFDLARLLKKAVVNSAFSVIFGKRFDYEDKELNDFLQEIEFIEAAKGSLKPFSLRDIPGDPFKIRDIVRAYNSVCSFYKRQIDEHLENANSQEQQPTDMLYEHIKKYKDETQDTSSRHDLVRTMYDSIGAAKATLSPPLMWSILHLTRNPDVQEKIHRDIKETIHQNELPDTDDFDKLPYLKAAVLETLRLGASVPFTFPYMSNGNVHCLGYRFPQNAVIFPHLRSVLRDDEVWGDADKFRPSRFLNDDSSELKNVKEWIPFSIGPKRCPGEKLAMSAFHLFLSGLLQRYKLLPEESDKMPSTDFKMNLFIEPQPFLVRAVSWEKIPVQ